MDDSLKIVLWELPHVKFVSLASGNYCLMVEGTMLNDFVEDHLWDDYQYHTTAVAMDTPYSIPVYSNYLTADLPVAPFIDALNLLDPVEVERISKLNP